jgi:uncharacterized damage-inducible protein DinB
MSPDPTIPTITEPLVGLLRQLATVIEGLDADQYCARRVSDISGSIGGHVRHCLDHVRAFVAGAECGHVEYDSRLRGTLVESRREAALLEILRLQRRVAELDPSLWRAPLMLMSLDSDSPVAVAQSSVARELAFVVSHTIHHCAIIAFLLRELGVPIPNRFGFAPSTPAPAASARCA